MLTKASDFTLNEIYERLSTEDLINLRLVNQTCFSKISSVFFSRVAIGAESGSVGHDELFQRYGRYTTSLEISRHPAQSRGGLLGRVSDKLLNCESVECSVFFPDQATTLAGFLSQLQNLQALELELFGPVDLGGLAPVFSNLTSLALVNAGYSSILRTIKSLDCPNLEYLELMVNRNSKKLVGAIQSGFPGLREVAIYTPGNFELLYDLEHGLFKRMGNLALGPVHASVDFVPCLEPCETVRIPGETLSQHCLRVYTHLYTLLSKPYTGHPSHVMRKIDLLLDSTNATSEVPALANLVNVDEMEITLDSPKTIHFPLKPFQTTRLIFSFNGPLPDYVWGWVISSFKSLVHLTLNPTEEDAREYRVDHEGLPRLKTFGTRSAGGNLVEVVCKCSPALQLVVSNITRDECAVLTLRYPTVYFATLPHQSDA